MESPAAGRTPRRSAPPRSRHRDDDLPRLAAFEAHEGDDEDRHGRDEPDQRHAGGEAGHPAEEQKSAGEDDLGRAGARSWTRYPCGFFATCRRDGAAPPLRSCRPNTSLIRLKEQNRIAPMPTMVGMMRAANAQPKDCDSMATNRQSSAAGNRLLARKLRVAPLREHVFQAAVAADVLQQRPQQTTAPP